jgi:hypothetical protein
MIPEEAIASSGIDEPQELLALLEEARQVLLAHSWCRAVDRISFCCGFSKVAVFFCEIQPDRTADPSVWAIVGDLPPAVIDVSDYSKDCVEALECYLGLRQEWAEAAIEGRAVDEMMPVQRRGSLVTMEPTPEIGALLLRRVEFIEKNVLPLCRDQRDGRRVYASPPPWW